MKYSNNDRNLAIMKILISSNSYVSVEELAELLDFSKRNVYYSLENINRMLIEKGEEAITSIYGKGFLLDDDKKMALYSIYAASDSFQIYSLNSEERYSLIICELIFDFKRYIINTFEDLFGVSRFTLINDINTIKSLLSQFNLVLSFSTKKGYEVVGKEYNKRKAFSYFFSNIYDIYTNHFSLLHNFEFVRRLDESIRHKLCRINESNTFYSSSITCMAILMSRCEISVTSRIDKSFIPIRGNLITDYIDIIINLFPKLNNDEVDYFATILFASKIQNNYGSLFEKSVCEIVIKMNKAFYQLTTIDTINFELYEMLVRHIVNAYQRYKYSIVVDNSLINIIRSKYAFYFENVKRASQCINEYFDTVISDTEIAFIALYYAGYCVKNLVKIDNLNVVLVCINGLATSYLLKKEIESLDSRVSVTNVYNIHEFKKSTINCDFVISTVNIQEYKKPNIIVVNPLLTNDDKSKIISMVDTISKTEKTSVIHTCEIDEAGNYTIDFHPVFKKNFVNIVETKNMLWDEIVELAAQPLISEGYIPKEYVSQIISITEEYGNYMITKNGYFFGHATTNLSKKLGLAFLKLNEPYIVDNKEVSKLFIVTPVNGSSHHPLISGLLKLFENKELSDYLDCQYNTEIIYKAIVDCLISSEDIISST